MPNRAIDLCAPSTPPTLTRPELGLEGRLTPMALVKEWEKELAALAPTVRVGST